MSDTVNVIRGQPAEVTGLNCYAFRNEWLDFDLAIKIFWKFNRKFYN